MKIQEDKFVAVTYDLYVGEGEERELMEQATQEEPLRFIYGTGTMLPAFENAIRDLATGSDFTFTIEPKDAYGEYEEGNLLDLPKNLFEVNGKFDEEMVKEGAILPMMDADGQRINGLVLEVTKENVSMDFNHPLAGETLHFKGKVIEVRDPSPDDMHILTGCSSGCGDNCSDGCCDDSSSCGSCGCH